MRLIVAIAGAGLLLLAGCDAYAGHAADAIEQQLRSSSSVSFYFVSRTENYDYDARTIQSEASVQVRRSCGANCHNFMEPVLANLRASKTSSCLPGQQDLLITFGESQIIYSYSGRHVMYQDQCYFNPESVHQLLKSDGFFFR
ncbi:hypothetical protein H9645_05295 [Luteimonas sp. Sa2BVA3]|uniref:Lipoprotein n=1 Tax=Luteimonas colneyensis TaxID=2762230 RepID=A0ABR8UIF9_9GAMM|nr:hypothetical protein [Luteimonas colneyensis]MBD7987439.1 hypothetical protein [Luteimonas colneyensis]